jgi:tripartite ATP-independent transporter DctP family solute receptor
MRRATKMKAAQIGFAVKLAALLCLAASSAMAMPRTFKFGFILSPHSQLGAGAAAFAEEIRRRSQGRRAVELYPNAMLGGEVEMLKALQLGTVDLAFITGATLPSVLPEAGVFNIPFLFRDIGHARRLLDGPIGQSYLPKFRDRHLVALAWGENGLRQLTTGTRPVSAPRDLVGLKLRLPQSEVMSEGFKALGVEVTLMPFPQVYSALQSGVVDGQENPIATIKAAKFDHVQKYLNLTGHVYDPALIIMSEDAYGELSADERLHFTEAARVAGQASRAFAADAEARGLESLTKAGMIVTRDIDHEAFVQAMSSALPLLESRFGAQLIREIRDAR